MAQAEQLEEERGLIPSILNNLLLMMQEETDDKCA